jgi:hypothetical protein
MPSRRRVLEYWTEVKRIVSGKVKVTTCCCGAPGATPRECAIASRNKTPCRCDCHRGEQKRKGTKGDR